MKLDLNSLKQMHPLLPTSTAYDLAFKAALGMERNGHDPGVWLETSNQGSETNAELYWEKATAEDDLMVDAKRVTEDAAEAVTLAFVHQALGWQVRRRLQQGDSADWLLRDPQQRLIALEVSGTDSGDVRSRLRQKLEQVQNCEVCEDRFAAVVELTKPALELARVET